MGMFEGEMSGENVWGKCLGKNVWGSCRGGGGGERNVGIPKINSHLLERHINNKYLL